MFEAEQSASAQTILPSILVIHTGAKNTYRCFASEWQNEIIDDYCSGKRGSVDISERIDGAHQRSLTFESEQLKDTLYDHPLPAGGSTGRCTHSNKASFDSNNGYALGNNARTGDSGWAVPFVCLGCSQVFRNQRSFGGGQNPKYQGEKALDGTCDWRRRDLGRGGREFWKADNTA